MMSKTIKCDDLAPLRESVATAVSNRDDAQRGLDFARSEVARLLEERKSLPINIEARRTNHADAATAETMVVDAERLLSIAQEDLAVAETALANGERSALYAAAIASRDATVDAIRDKFPKITHTLAALQDDIRKTDALIARVNSDLPDGAERLAGVEGAMNRVGARPYELISDETVDLWCYPDEREPLDESMQLKVVPAADGTGSLTGNAVDFGESTHRNVVRGLVRKTFRRVRYRGAEHGLHIQSIVEAKLPPLCIVRSDTRVIETRYTLLSGRS